MVRKLAREIKIFVVLCVDDLTYEKKGHCSVLLINRILIKTSRNTRAVCLKSDWSPKLNIDLSKSEIQHPTPGRENNHHYRKLLSRDVQNSRVISHNMSVMLNFQHSAQWAVSISAFSFSNSIYGSSKGIPEYLNAEIPGLCMRYRCNHIITWLSPHGLCKKADISQTTYQIHLN